MARYDTHGNELTAVIGNAGTVVASATGAAAAAVSATLAAAANLTTYICGFQVTSTNPAATVSGLVTVTGLVGGATLSYEFVESNTFGGELLVQFANPIPANAVNTAIVVNCAAITSGGAVAIAVQGFQQA